MGFVPQDAKWYVAEMIQEICVAGHENVVHKNLVLIRADSPDEAYESAITLGTSGNTEYLNSSGELVEVKFRGLGHLDVIHDELQHGAELLFEQKVNVSDSEINSWVREHEALLLFKELEHDSTVPDYGSGEIRDEALLLIREDSRDHPDGA